VTGRDPGELLGQEVTDHVMAFLLKPVGEAQLKAAIPLALRRFEQYQALRAEAASLRQALEGRRLVERAKGALVRRLRVGEEEAFPRLYGRARATNRKGGGGAGGGRAPQEGLRAPQG